MGAVSCLSGAAQVPWFCSPSGTDPARGRNHPLPVLSPHRFRSVTVAVAAAAQTSPVNRGCPVIMQIRAAYQASLRLRGRPTCTPASAAKSALFSPSAIAGGWQGGRPLCRHHHKSMSSPSSPSSPLAEAIQLWLLNRPCECVETQEPAEAALKHRLIIALKHASSSASGSGHWFSTHLDYSLSLSLSSLLASAMTKSHAVSSRDNMRLPPQASLRQRCPLLGRQLQDCLCSVTLSSQASESVVEAVSDLLLASTVVLAVLSHVRVSE